MEDIFARLYEMTAFSNIIAEPQFLIMYAIAFILLYLGIKKKYEPLLLIPIAFGVLLANFPGGEMGVVQADENGMVMVNGVMKNIWEMPLHEIAHDLGLMNFIYYMLIKTGFLPPIIFMGVGALTDFGPMLRNLRLSIFGAAAQLGIFTVLLVAILMGFTPKEAASLGIIGGADGPTAIFTTIKLAPHLLGPIAIAAYSYMALVPVIIPLVVKLWCTKKELSINMKEQEKKYPSKTEIKNLRVLKILFPIVVTTVVALFVPSAVPLIGMLMFGNLVKEIGSDTSRLFDAASNSIMNAATIFLGLSVGATMTTEAFLNWTTIGIVIGGFLAFALSISGTVKGANVNVEDIENLISAIVSVPIDDGVKFQLKSISEIMDEAEYPGIRVSMTTTFDGVVTPLKIDISTGDAITPREVRYSFKLMLEDRSIDIWAYNLETVLAEKLETIITRTTTNTRMRDFYDIYILDQLHGNTLNRQTLYDALLATAKKRGTERHLAEAVDVLNEVESSPVMQKLWESYRRKFSYAADLEWNIIMRAVRSLYALSEKESSL